MPNSSPIWRVPKISPTRPLVSGTVPVQIKPIAAANTMADACEVGSERNSTNKAVRAR